MKRIASIIAGVLLIGSLAYAGNGDLIVNGVVTANSGVRFSDQTLQTTAAVTSVTVPVRQTVLSGATNTNGQPSFITAGSGLSPQVLGTSVPVYIAFAAGFGSKGANDYVGSISADSSVNVAPNLTHFIYADRNPDTGAITLGTSTLAPVYQYSAPTPYTNGQHWFSLADYQMRIHDVSGWTIVQRVFLGEAVTGPATVTSVITYALQGKYTGEWTNTLIGKSTRVSKNHNIGVVPQVVELLMKCLTAEGSYAVGDVINGVTTHEAGYGHRVPAIVRDRLSCGYSTSSYTAHILMPKMGGDAYSMTAVRWAYSMVASRGW